MKTNIEGWNRETTIPWSDDEMIHVDGFPLVYSWTDGAILVHLPGATKRHARDYRVDELLLAGYDVRMPRVIRRFT